MVAAKPSFAVISGADAGRQDGPCLASDVALIVTDNGDGCIVDLDGSFYAVSVVAAALIRDTLTHGREAAVANGAARYGVDSTRIGRDLDDLLDDLGRRGLLLRQSERRHRVEAREIMAGALAGLAHCLLRLPGTLRSRAWIALSFARLSFLVSGWNATAKAWRKRSVGPGTASKSQGGEHARAIDSAIRSAAARHLMNIDCKERALAGFALARRVGLPADLVVGVGFYPLAGHSWCEAGDTVIGDDASNCRRFAPAFRLS